MSDDGGLQCTEFSHSFLDHSSSYIVGYRCDSVGLFVGIVVLAFFLVIGQNVLATKDGQASRQALLTKKGSPERQKIIWTLLWYTFLSSLLGTIHVLLVVGMNIYVLSALLLGNLAGVFWSYHEQKADDHDNAADLNAVLKLAREHPDDEKWQKLREDLLCFLQLPSNASSPKQGHSNSTEIQSMRIDYDCKSAATRIRRGTHRAASNRFAPYSDHRGPVPHHNLAL